MSESSRVATRVLTSSTNLLPFAAYNSLFAHTINSRIVVLTMIGAPEQQDKVSSFSELYPHLTEQEHADAEDRFDRYLALAVRIFKRLESDPSFRRTCEL